MNKKLFYILFNFANKTERRKIIISNLINITSLIFKILYIAGFFYIIINHFNYIFILKYIFIPISAFFLSYLIRQFVKSKRPFEVFDIKSIIEHKGGRCLPSNHAVMASVLAVALYCIFPHTFYFIFILTLITSIIRVMAGVHFPIDIIFGLIFGFFYSYIGFIIF